MSFRLHDLFLVVAESMPNQSRENYESMHQYYLQLMELLMHQSLSNWIVDASISR